ncbi:unnamed protein product [Cochlearia groenlandica]
MNGEVKPPHELKNTLQLSPLLISNPSLPDDILISLLSRVSRLYYQTFSLSCLYVSLRLLTDSNLCWFTLCRVPDRKLTNFSCGHLLVPILSPQAPPPAYLSSVIAVDSNIYNDELSSSVFFLDCHCDTWRIAPSMQVARSYPTTSVLDGKIYVAGGCEYCNSLNCIEVFDPKTQLWEAIASPGTERCDKLEYKSVGIEGKFHLFGGAGHMAYDPKEGRWDSIGMDIDVGRAWVSYTVVINILFYYNDRDREFKWYDYKGRFWRKLMCLERLVKFLCYSRVNLSDYVGKIVVM